MNVTFIGLGIMGSRMAGNLLKNGVNLKVFSRSPESVTALKEAGAQTADSFGEAVADADIIFSMLSTPEVVEKVFLSPGGALHQMKSNALWVDSTTVNPSFSIMAAKVAKQNGIRFLDAPVAGTKPHAENAQLTFFVGGETDDLREVKGLLDYMGQKILHVGATGQGASFKMLVNALLAQSMLIFSETVLLGEKLGFSQDFLLNTLPNLVVSAPFTKAKAEMIREDNYEVQFPLEWMHKDLHLATLTAYEQGQPLYLANLVKTLYASAKERGLGREDFAAIHRFLAG